MTFHYALMKTYAMFNRQITYRAQNELGLSLGQPKVLDCLIDHEGSDQKTIAAICEIEQATLGSILLRMEEKGLVERKRLDGNRRSLHVFLTEKGKETAEKMQIIFEEEDKNALSHIEDSEQRELIKKFEMICRNMEKMGETVE